MPVDQISKQEQPVRNDEASQLKIGPLGGAFREPTAARSQERATANSRPLRSVICYLTLALAAAAAVAEGSAKAMTASPSSKVSPGSPPKP
jgi:hypothetical protein